MKDVVKEVNLQITYTDKMGTTQYYYCVFILIELICSNLKRGIRRNNKRPNLNAIVMDFARTEVEKID